MQTEVSSTNRPSTSAQKTMVDRPELLSQSRAPTPFSLEGELAKVKIPIPLSELMSKNAYRSQVIKALSIEPDIGTKALTVGSMNHSDTVNLTDDQPELLFGPEVDGQTDTGAVAPFYISLNIHDLILHNAMLDSGASHNLMPKAVMEKLGLEVTRPYKDLHSFDSSKVRCIRVDQRLMHHPSSDSSKKHGYGCCGHGHSPEIWYVVVQVLGGQVERHFAVGYVICHHPSIRTTEKTVQRDADEIYGQQPRKAT
jgi:hypothetical protein